jgi:hypothetical protein
MLGKALAEAVSHGLTTIEPAQLHLTWALTLVKP